MFYGVFCFTCCVRTFDYNIFRRHGFRKFTPSTPYITCFGHVVFNQSEFGSIRYIFDYLVFVVCEIITYDLVCDRVFFKIIVKLQRKNSNFCTRKNHNAFCFRIFCIVFVTFVLICFCTYFCVYFCYRKIFFCKFIFAFKSFLVMLNLVVCTDRVKFGCIQLPLTCEYYIAGRHRELTGGGKYNCFFTFFNYFFPTQEFPFTVFIGNVCRNDSYCHRFTVLLCLGFRKNCCFRMHSFPFITYCVVICFPYCIKYDVVVFTRHRNHRLCRIFSLNSIFIRAPAKECVAFAGRNYISNTDFNIGEILRSFRESFCIAAVCIISKGIYRTGKYRIFNFDLHFFSGSIRIGKNRTVIGGNFAVYTNVQPIKICLDIIGQSIGTGGKITEFPVNITIVFVDRRIIAFRSFDRITGINIYIERRTHRVIDRCVGTGHYTAFDFTCNLTENICDCRFGIGSIVFVRSTCNRLHRCFRIAAVGNTITDRVNSGSGCLCSICFRDSTYTVVGDFIAINIVSFIPLKRIITTVANTITITIIESTDNMREFFNIYIVIILISNRYSLSPLITVCRIAVCENNNNLLSIFILNLSKHILRCFDTKLDIGTTSCSYLVDCTI